jgi:hypothetical protein
VHPFRMIGAFEVDLKNLATHWDASIRSRNLIERLGYNPKGYAFALRLEKADLFGLVLGQHFRNHAPNADLCGNGLRGLLIIAGDHDGLDASDKGCSDVRELLLWRRLHVTHSGLHNGCVTTESRFGNALLAITQVSSGLRRPASA